ncbi:MAG: LpxD N-terminal domain-containing protein, partial [Myxococcota bacterium]
MAAVGGPLTVAALAAALGAVVEGDAEQTLTDVRGLTDAGPTHLSFFANRRYATQLRETRAGAV